MRGKELLLLRGTLGGNEEPISGVQKQEIPIPDDVLNGSFKVYRIIYSSIHDFLDYTLGYLKLKFFFFLWV